ncbi:MAG: 4-hydroxythreonine-4-phosphate dehydrogenase PdxA [Gammaproteobacteria bacterium]|nr:MAG: 4-hydroxythreonine-4-phosphate dehydrogenase PdxA [Gammaproteobacteria bacterium]
MITRLLVTPGEPAGVGLDICLQLSRHEFDTELILVTDPDILLQRAQLLDIDFELQLVSGETPAKKHAAGTLKVLPVNCPSTVVAGTLNPENASFVIKSLTLATDLIQQGTHHALVTGPVHKGNINDAGIQFTGHTEWLAEKTHSVLPVMMLANNKLRVALVTTHLPLKDVSAIITRDRLVDVIRILNQDLKQRFSIKHPHIRICGLNPHAGESGHLGTEEIDTIIPAISQLQSEGMQLEGPLPADTAFLPDSLEGVDAILCMYHDQGLPVLKFADFEGAINITLGLPIIRTSVDHGTALHLAGTGKANPTSLFNAIHVASSLAKSLS